jgi:hypothetical protein
MARFEYTDPGKARLQLEPITERGERMVMLSALSPEANLVVVDIPLDRVEEVVSGIRDMARQAGGVPSAPRRRLTELEHDAAWHAIEGAAGQEGADPGTVLNAVLHALNIDPPGTRWTPCTPAWLATQPAGACDTTPRRSGHGDVSHYHLAAEGAGA